MGKHKLEDYFKDRLSQHEEHIDKNELWASLGMEAEPKRKKILWPWFFGLGLMLVVAGVGTYSYMSSYKASYEETAEIYSEGFSDNIVKQESKDSNPEKQEDSKTVHTDEAIPKRNSTNEITESLTKKNINRIGIEKTNLPTQNIVPLNKIVIPEFNSESVEQNNSTQVGIAQFHDLSKTSTGTVKNDRGRYQSLDRKNDGSLNKVYNLISTIDKLTTIQPQQLELKKFIYHLDESDFIPVVAQDDLLNTTVKKEVPVDSPQWTAGMYATLYKTFRNLKGNDGQELYINKRNELETLLETIVSGGFVQRRLGRSSYFKLGLEYQSIAERFDFKNFVDTTFAESAVEYEATLLREWKTFNSHRMINVPVTLGYTTALGKWNVSAELTPVVTIQRSFKGLFLETEDSVTRTTDHFSTGISMAGRLSVGVSYAFDDYWSISFGPSFQQHFGSFTNGDKGYEQRYSMFGGQLALSYGF